MRILHVATSYPSYPGDSTAPFMEEALGALANRGHDVEIAVPRVEGLQEGPRAGIHVTGARYAPSRLQVWGYGRSLGETGLRPAAVAITPFAMTAMTLAVRSGIRRLQPDIVHLHWVLPTGALAAVVPRSIPVILSAHGADARMATGRLRAIARHSIRRADHLIAASSGILEVLSEVEPTAREKSSVIPHGARSDLFYARDRESARRELGLDPSGSIVVAVGRLVRKKGFDNAIRSIASLSGTRLYIVGEGPDRARLEELIGETGDTAHLVGQQAREKVAHWLAASDVVCVPSLVDRRDIDSGPVVLMEALAAGRPVVATRIGMAPDMIRDGENGYLVEPSERVALADAIGKAISDSGRLGASARLTFERIGDWDRVAGQLEDVYDHVIENLRHDSS